MSATAQTMGSSGAASDDEEDEGFDWSLPLFAAARGGKSDVPASEGDLDLPEMTGLTGVALARRALDEGASLVAMEPASQLTALALAMSLKVVDVARYLQMRYVRAMAAGLEGEDEDGSGDVPLPEEIDQDATAQLVEAIAKDDLGLAHQARHAGAILTTISLDHRRDDLGKVERNEADEEGYAELDPGTDAVNRLGILLSKNATVAAFIAGEVERALLDLLAAAQCGNLKAAKLARAAGAELEVVDPEYSYTPLLWAGRLGSTELVRTHAIPATT